MTPCGLGQAHFDMLKFAFYHAVPGKFADRVIRLASGSRFSHVEFVLSGPMPEYGYAVCVSASKRDGNKVRTKPFQMNPAHWAFVEVEGDYMAARKYALSQIDQPYNMLGAALSITPCTAKVGRGLFCSEFMGLIARAGGLDIPDPHTLTPQEFYDILEAHSGMKRAKAVAQKAITVRGGK